MTPTNAATALLTMAEALKTCQDRCSELHKERERARLRAFRLQGESAELIERLAEAERKRDEWAGLYVEAETELLALRGER